MVIQTSQQFTSLKLTDRYDPVLHRPAEVVTKEAWPHKDKAELLREMKKLCQIVGGVGLAAPQVGVGAQMALVASEDGFIRAINPKIEQLAGKRIKSKEGCLSLPYEDWIVERHTKIKVSYQDLSGKLCFREASGFEAIIWQHEISHCQGHLISEGEQFIAEKGIIKP